jgi:hypothetical protein
VKRALLLACGLAVGLRLQALHMPLDRDLADYATIGQNLRHGFLPYRDLFDHKQPLIYPLYGLLDLIAPRSTAAVRIAAGLVAGLAAWTLFRLLRGPGGTVAAGAGAGLALLWGASDFTEGTGLNTEHLLVLVECVAVAVALRAPPGPRAAFGLGLLLALAVLTKAVGLFLAPALLVAVGRDPRRLAAFTAGAAGPLLALAAGYAAAGGLEDLWYANVTYNRLYVGQPFLALPNNPAVLALAAGAVLAVAPRLRGWRDDRVLQVLLAWLAGSLLGAHLSTNGFPHYYAPVVPPACALLALALTASPRRRWAAALVALALVLPAVDLADRHRHRDVALSYDLFLGQTAWWRDAEVLGPKIRARARPGDRMYAEGTDPNYYWQADVRPATQFFYNLPVVVDPERWSHAVERDVCGPGRLPRFLVRQIELPLEAVPSCLASAPYVEFARHGLSIAYELR